MLWKQNGNFCKAKVSEPPSQATPGLLKWVLLTEVNHSIKAVNMMEVSSYIIILQKNRTLYLLSSLEWICPPPVGKQ